MAGGILNDPYFAFGATLLAGGDIEDAFGIFSQTQNFKEAQKRAALENQQIQQAINEANREAEYKQKMDQALNMAARSGGGMRSMVEAVQPYLLGLTGDIGKSMMPQNQYATLMEDPNTVGQYRIDPFTGEETRIGGGYSDYKRQMDVLQQTFANNQALQGMAHANRMKQIGAGNAGRMEAERLALLGKATEGKLAAMDRAGNVQAFFPGDLGNQVAAIASQINLTEDQGEIEKNRILRKMYMAKQGAGPEPTPAELETYNAILQTEKVMSPEQSMEAALLQDRIPQLKPTDIWGMGQPAPDQTGYTTGGTMSGDEFNPQSQMMRNAASGPTSMMEQPEYPGGSAFPARPMSEEEERGMLMRLMDMLMGN